MTHQTLKQAREITPPMLQRKIAAAKAEALIDAAADHPTVTPQLNRRAMAYARRAGDLQRAHHEAVTGVPAVTYTEDVDSDVAPFRGCVSGSNREVAPFGLDWTKPGWFPATGRGASRGATPNPFPPPVVSPRTLGELGTRSVSR